MENPPEEEVFVLWPAPYGRKKLNALYRAIPLRDTTFRLLRKYFQAMAILYGVIPLKKAKEVVFSASPGLMTEDEFWQFAEIARHENEGYYVLGLHEVYSDEKKKSLKNYYLIDDMLLADEEDTSLFDKILHQQSGKPFYMPSKEALLPFANRLYCEDRSEKEALKAFFRGRLRLSDEEAEKWLQSIEKEVRYDFTDNDLEKFMEQVEKVKVRLSESESQQMLNLYNAFHNSIRLPDNCGYTPSEMASLLPRAKKPDITFGKNLRAQLQSGEIDPAEMYMALMTDENFPDEGVRKSVLQTLADAAKPQKIGRNAPCPCGSGKNKQNTLPN